MGAGKRSQKYRAAEEKAVKATSNLLRSGLRAKRSGGDPGIEQARERDRAASIKANAVKDSLKAPSTKMKKLK